MKRIFYLFLIVAAVSCCRPKGNSFFIEGDIDGVKDSVLVFLVKMVDPISGAGKGIMNDTLINGKFSFNVTKEDLADKYEIMLISLSEALPSQSATVYAEPGRKAVITGTGVSPMKWKVRSKVKKQKDWQIYLNYAADIYSETGLALMDRNMPADRYSAMIDSLNNLCFEKTMEYLESEKVSEIWIDEFHSWAKYAGVYNNEDMKARVKALLPKLSEEQMKTPLVQDALPYLDVTIPLNVGDSFPELNLYDADGLPHKISDFSGKKVLIELSEFGCAPCKLAGLEIEELCRMHPDDFVTLIVNQNGYEIWRKEVVASAVPNKFEFNDDNGSSGIFKRLGTGGYPTFVLISPEGIITDIWAGYVEGSLLERI